MMAFRIAQGTLFQIVGLWFDHEENTSSGNSSLPLKLCTGVYDYDAGARGISKEKKSIA